MAKENAPWELAKVPAIKVLGCLANAEYPMADSRARRMLERQSYGPATPNTVIYREGLTAITIAVKPLGAVIPAWKLTELLINGLSSACCAAKTGQRAERIDFLQAIQSYMEREAALRCVDGRMLEAMEPFFELYEQIQPDFDLIRQMAQNQTARKDADALFCEVRKAIRAQLDRKFDRWEEAVQAAGRNLTQLLMESFNRCDWEQEDGWCVRRIPLEGKCDAADEETLVQLFGSWDRLSLGALCSDVILMLPLHPEISKLVSAERADAGLSQPDGEKKLSIVLREDHGWADTPEKVKEVLYQQGPTGAVVCCNSALDPLTRVLCYGKAVSTLNPAIPVFQIQTHLDEYQEFIEISTRDLLTDQCVDETLDLQSVTLRHSREMLRQLSCSTSIAPFQLSMEQATEGEEDSQLLSAYYRGTGKRRPENSVQIAIPFHERDKAPLKPVLEAIIPYLVSGGKAACSKMNCTGGNISVNVAALREYVQAMCKEQEMQKKVFFPAAQRITEQRGKKITPEAYADMRQKLRYGLGWHGVDEKRELSVEISFPANIKNLLNKQARQLLPEKCLVLDGLAFSSEAERRSFLTRTGDLMKGETLVARLAYDRVLLRAEEEHAAADECLEAFFGEMARRVESPADYEEEWTGALAETLRQAGLEALHSYMEYN